MGKYSYHNRFEVAEQVEELIREGEKYKKVVGYSKKWRIADVCDSLSIFDWWNEWLSVSQLKQMRSFLKTAGELGYNGYVCFKVGAAGCSHGMWAHKAESENGYSPDGECLYHSFRNGDNYWDACLADGAWAHKRVEGKLDFTLAEIKSLISA